MIRSYKFEDRTTLCDFFAIVLEEHKDYISHGELQMGIATEPGILATDYKQKWLQYLDRQTANPSNTVLLYEDNGILTGFIIFGVMEDGAAPYGVIFDMAVAPDARGKRIGEQLLEKAIENFRERGIRNCYLESGVNNHSAHHFFQKHGFAQVSDIFRMKL